MSNEKRKMNIVGGLTKQQNAGRTCNIKVMVYESYGYSFDDRHEDFDVNHEYNEVYLRSIVDYLSNWYNERGFLFLNEALHAFNFETISSGQVAGWHMNNGENLEISVDLVELSDRPGTFKHWITFEPHGVIVNNI